MDTTSYQKGIWLYLLFTSFDRNVRMSGVQYFEDQCSRFGSTRAWELTSSHSIHGRKFADRPRSTLKCNQPQSRVLPGGGGSKILYVEVADWLDLVQPPTNGDIVMVKLIGPLLVSFECKLNVGPLSTDIFIVYDSKPGKCMYISIFTLHLNTTNHNVCIYDSAQVIRRRVCARM